MISFNEFLNHHEKQNDDLRLGQRFCNYYIKGQWPKLYYADYQEAKKLIFNFLIDNNYQDKLPKRIKDK